MSDEPLRPGDPPPFWDGLWHPEGKAEGAVMVKPRVMAQVAVADAAPVVPPTATATVPAAAPRDELPAPPAAAQAPAPRSYVAGLLARGPLVPVAAPPATGDAAAAAAARDRARALAGQKQFAPALAALDEALGHAPGDAATYAQLGGLMLALRAWDDAAHHFLLAYMLAPREAGHGRMAIHAAFALGYVGVCYQLAQALYKAQPAPDLAEIGRVSQGWLKERPSAVTALCPACRTPALQEAAGPCGRCGAQVIGAAANPLGLGALRLLRQGENGRLFVGGTCAACDAPTPLVLARGGVSCLHCRGAALKPL